MINGDCKTWVVVTRLQSGAEAARNVAGILGKRGPYNAP